MRRIGEYKTIAFDCDGVILNSNGIKTDAFYEVALPYGTEAADALKAHHISCGGVSRNLKFSYLFSNILRRAPEPGEINALLKRYGNLVSSELMAVEITPGLETFRAETQPAKWVVVSGGNQAELRSLFSYRNLNHLFDTNSIFGSPRSKNEIVRDEKKKGLLASPLLFLGDSHYDYDVAKQHNFDFVFVRDWSEWSKPVLPDNVTIVDHVVDLTKNVAEVGDGN
jgi:phosphoglycolate phosphatase-like HAD superfamily hydrolase